MDEDKEKLIKAATKDIEDEQQREIMIEAIRQDTGVSYHYTFHIDFTIQLLKQAQWEKDEMNAKYFGGAGFLFNMLLQAGCGTTFQEMRNFLRRYKARTGYEYYAIDCIDRNEKGQCIGHLMSKKKSDELFESLKATLLRN